MSMTDHIRTGSGSQLVTGHTVTSELFVRVKWSWLALPLFEALAGVSLLLTAIFWSRRKGVELWKDSFIAVLFSECTDGTLRTSAEGRERVEEWAKNVRARLKQG